MKREIFCSLSCACRHAPPVGWDVLELPSCELLWLLGRNPARLFRSIQFQAGGREFCDLPTARRPQLNVEDLRANQAANCAFIHREEVAANPVPTLVVVVVIDANTDLRLRLSPE